MLRYVLQKYLLYRLFALILVVGFSLFHYRCPPDYCVSDPDPVPPNIIYFLENNSAENLRVYFPSLPHEEMQGVEVAAGETEEIFSSFVYGFLASEEDQEFLHYQVYREVDDTLLADGILWDFGKSDDPPPSYYAELIPEDPTIESLPGWFAHIPEENTSRGDDSEDLEPHVTKSITKSETDSDCNVTNYYYHIKAVFEPKEDFIAAHIQRAFRLYNNSPEQILVITKGVGQDVIPRRTVIPSEEIATIYETTATFTGPVTYQIYRDSDNMLLLEDILRNYSDPRQRLRLDWQHRSQADASLLILPTETGYPHEYYAVYPNPNMQTAR